MRGATAVAPVGAPKKGHMSELEDGKEGTGLLNWASSGVTRDCGEVGLALARYLSSRIYYLRNSEAVCGVSLGLGTERSYETG